MSTLHTSSDLAGTWGVERRRIVNFGRDSRLHGRPASHWAVGDRVARFKGVAHLGARRASPKRPGW